jgi:hypothetical protein
VADGGESGTGDEADIAASDHGDLHPTPPSR